MSTGASIIGRGVIPVVSVTAACIASVLGPGAVLSSPCIFLPEWTVTQTNARGQYGSLAPHSTGSTSFIFAMETKAVDDVWNVTRREIRQFSMQGATVWSVPCHFPDQSEIRIKTLALLPNGEFVVGGAERKQESARKRWDGRHWYVSRLDRRGVVVWANRRIESRRGGWGEVRALGVDPGGNVIAAGFSGVRPDWYLAKYALDGSMIWERTFAGRGGNWDEATALHIDARGHVYVAGYMTMEDSLDERWVIRKYLPDGSLAWSTTTGVPGCGNQPDHMIGGPDGNLYISGFTSASPYHDEFDMGHSGYVLTVASLTTDGRLIWSRTMGRERMNPPEHAIGFTVNGELLVPALPDPYHHTLDSCLIIYGLTSVGKFSRKEEIGRNILDAHDPEGVIFCAGRILLTDQADIREGRSTVNGANGVIRAVPIDCPPR